MLLASLLYLSSCTKVETIDVDAVPQASLLQRDMKKWAEERELQKQQDESDQAFLNRVKEMYDAYYAALRAYKKSDHKVVYGWFSGWTATPGVERSFLSNLPDSVDIVSLWGGTSPFDENDPRWEDLRIAQEVKGLKVLLCWQTGSSGLGLPGGVEAFNERHQGKTSVQKAIAYAQELTKFIKDHNLNGYDIDWEPNVGDHGGGCHNLYQNCDGNEGSSAPIRAFIQEMGKNFGPKQEIEYDPRGTGTLFLFDGEVRDMAGRFGDMGGYFDYFLNQNYYSVRPNHEFYDTSSIAEWSWKKYITCDEFEKDAKNGGVCSPKPCCITKAKMVRDNNYGGWGAYHIELDENYKWTKEVIQVMNPSHAFNPNEHSINELLDPQGNEGNN